MRTESVLIKNKKRVSVILAGSHVVFWVLTSLVIAGFCSYIFDANESWLYISFWFLVRYWIIACVISLLLFAFQDILEVDRCLK